MQLEANKIEQKEDEDEDEDEAEGQRSAGRRTFHDNCVRTRTLAANGGNQRDKQLESEHFLLMPFAHFSSQFFVLYCITFALPENIKNNAHRLRQGQK